MFSTLSAVAKVDGGGGAGGGEGHEVDKTLEVKSSVWVCRFTVIGNTEDFTSNVLSTSCPSPPPAPPPPATFATAESVENMGHVAYRALATQLRAEAPCSSANGSACGLPALVKGGLGLSELLETAAEAGGVKDALQALDAPSKTALVGAMRNGYELLDSYPLDT